MAAAISDNLQIESELIEGGGGIFDVKVDDQLIFSKQKENRFPDHQEILDAISRLG